MTRTERIDEKAARLLADGRVQLQHVTAHEVVADVLGDSGRWHVAFGRGGWTCDCPVLRGSCSHLAAVRRVVSPTTRGGVPA